MGSLETSDREAAAVAKAPRVTLESIMAKVIDKEFIRPNSHEFMTIAIVKLQNGFVLVGKSAPASPENFNEALGQKFAFEDAIRQAWQFEGYLLREQLYQQEPK